MKKHRLSKAGVVAGLTAGTLAGVAFGVPAISLAQDATNTTPAESVHNQPALQDEQRSNLLEALQPLIDDATITQTQADAVVTALEDARPPGGGPHGERGRGPGLDAAAGAIGISADDLRQALSDGGTVADVAQAHGVEVQTVIDAMVADLQTHLAQEVASGEHTQDEADAKLAEATERITAMVNGEMPAGPPHGADLGQS